MTITLEKIESEHKRLGEMIAALKLQPAFPISVAFPHLNEGEKWVGVVISADGRKRHHVILLPGAAEPASWDTQMKWAASIGGDLPDRVEGALLFAMQASGHLKDEFRPEWYWTNEKHVSYADYAWFQLFGDGGQSYDRTYNEFRARAVRRLVIE
jgi:hypothetical protein